MFPCCELTRFSDHRMPCKLLRGGAMRSRLALVTALLLAVSQTASACPGDGGGQQAPAGAGGYPRNETLYTSGTQWGPPSSWNPIIPGSVTGTVGLLYETLFLYDTT